MKYQSFSFLAIALLLAGAVHAQQRTDTEYTRLSNGMGVQIVSRPSALVAVSIRIRAGARYEQPGERGCAHFLEHLLFDGSQGYPQGAADSAMETLGGTLDADTGPDFVQINTTVPADNLAAALGILAALVQHPLLLPAAVERERAIILDELAMRRDNPTLLAENALYREAFAGSAYSHSPGGSPSAISVRARDTISAFYARCYHPERTVLVLAGSVQPQQALQVVNQYFGTWQNTAPVQPPTVHAPPVFSAAAPVILSSTLPQGRAAAAFRGPRASHRSLAAAAMLAAAILNHNPDFGLQSIPLLQNRHPQALYAPRLGPSLFLITARLKPDDTLQTAQQVEQALQQSVQMLRTSMLLKQPLIQGMAQVLADSSSETETDAGMAEMWSQALLTGGDPPDLLNQRMQQITEQNADTLLANYLTPSRACSVLLLPAPSKQP